MGLVGTRQQRRCSPRPCLTTAAASAYMPRLSSKQAGRMAEWLCRGLQILVQRFDSASGLQPCPFYTETSRPHASCATADLLSETRARAKPLGSHRLILGGVFTRCAHWSQAGFIYWSSACHILSRLTLGRLGWGGHARN